MPCAMVFAPIEVACEPLEMACVVSLVPNAIPSSVDVPDCSIFAIATELKLTMPNTPRPCATALTVADFFFPLANSDAATQVPNVAFQTIL